MKEIVIDFRRYKGLGFTVKESLEFARMRSRARQVLAQHERAAARGQQSSRSQS